MGIRPMRKVGELYYFLSELLPLSSHPSAFCFPHKAEKKVITSLYNDSPVMESASWRPLCLYVDVHQHAGALSDSAPITRFIEHLEPNLFDHQRYRQSFPGLDDDRSARTLCHHRHNIVGCKALFGEFHQSAQQAQGSRFISGDHAITLR